MKKTNYRLYFGWGILSFALTCVILLLSLWQGGMYPFGGGSLSWCDMNQQLIPLFCDFKDILSGEQSLFLNTANAGGMSFYAVFFFFLCSPFTFSVALVEKADIPFLMNILVVIKLALCAFTATVAFRKICPALKGLGACALGASYALCGYGMLFYQNIMWLDMMYLFPLVALGCFLLFSENRPVMLTLSLTACVLFNFHLSFMVYLFVIFFFGVFSFFGRADRRIYVNLGFSGILPLAATAVVWVPCLMQYTASARVTGFVAELQAAPLFSPLETTLPILLCSGLIFSALAILIPRYTLLKRETKGRLLIFMLCSVPLALEPVNLMWHTGSYMSFPARYGFIPAFLGLMLVGSEVEENSPVKTTLSGKIHLIGAGVLGVFGLLLSQANSETLSRYVNTLWGDKYSLRGQLFICLIFALCGFWILRLKNKGKITQRTMALMLCVIVGLQGLSSAGVYINTAKGSIDISRYNQVISTTKPQENSFYRVNLKGKLTHANMTGAAGFNSLGHYTSLNSGEFMETAKDLGYSGYWMETGNWGGSVLSDALLSVGYTATEEQGRLNLEKNPYYLPLGIKADSIPENLSLKPRLVATGEAFGKILGCENPVTAYTHTLEQGCVVYTNSKGEAFITTADAGVINYEIKVRSPQRLYFDCYNGFSVSLVEPVNNSFEVYVEGKQITSSYPSQNENGLLDLGLFQNQTVNITLKVLKDTDCYSFGVFGVNTEITERAVKNAATLNLTQKGGTIRGKAKTGKYFLSIPQSEGLSITLNGEKIKATKALGGFIGVDLPCDGELEITLTPKGFYAGLGISALGTALMILFFVLKRKIRNTTAGLCNVVYGIFLGFFAAAVIGVYIIPTIIALSDFKI